MGRKNEKKSAKGRLDKFYWLAKEQGYRARSAFKLVQLNKKYNFLENARCCIDLCAAPGGWLQVASKHMPPNSIIVGVDLVAIKPIPRCITFAEDINSYKCRDQLRSELKDWKADVVLHDGAPNVGTAWVQDAYAQSELVLQSLKLAVEFLTAGGTFVTKVFRSKDYNNLLWVFNQLFRKVEATKPPSSRNVSAEIFVVCQGYKAPSRIDPKFLDPRHVFKDLEPVTAPGSSTAVKGTDLTNVQANVFEPEKKRRKRDGYAEGDYILFKAIGASEYIRQPDPVAMLGTYNQIQFKTDEEKEFLAHEATNADITANCEDLRVLGKKDFKNLIKWRKELREHLGLETSNKPVEEETETVEVEPMDEDEQIEEELTRLNQEATARARKERRRKNENRQRTIQKLQLQMTTPMDIGMDQYDAALSGGPEDFFDLSTTEGSRKARRLARGEEFDESDEEDIDGVRSEAEDEDDEDEESRLKALEGDMDEMYDQYQQRMQERDAKFKAKEARRKDAHRDEWHGIRDDESDAGSANGDDGSSEGGYDVVERRKNKEETYDTDDEEDDADDAEDAAEEAAEEAAARTRKLASKVASGIKRKHGDEDARLVTSLESQDAAQMRQSKAAAVWFDNPLFKDVPELDLPDEDDVEEEEEEEEEEAASEDDDDFEVVPAEEEDVAEGEWNFSDEDEGERTRKRIADVGLNTAEAVSLAQALVNREKTKHELINEGFTKHNFVDKSDLPSWFLDDEGKHYKANIPITKEAVDALRARQRALDARPIKKIAEAKARAKYKAAQRLAKAQKKADSINETSDISEKEKASNISKLLAKGAKAPKRKETKLVVAKGVNRAQKGRPKGVKGRYKMVDARMRKELRAQKRKDKAAGKKTGGKPKRRVQNGY